MKKACRSIGILLTLVAIICVACIGKGFADGSWHSDYRYWSQNQTGYTNTNIYGMKDYGCCVVAQAKMLYGMGIDRSASFNPDRYLEWEVQNGFVADLGNIGQLSFSGPAEYASQKGCDVTYFGDDWDNTDDQIWFNINAGYWTIVEFPGIPHYVLVDNETSSATGQLYMFDSTRDYTYEYPRLLSSFGGRGRIFVYRCNSIPNHDPIGHLDEYSGGVGSIYVRGWAQDQDAPGQSLAIHVYVGGPAGSGASNHIITGNKYRSDLGGNFGFEETIPVNETGTQPIYIYAINVPNGGNPCIGTATVTISPKVTPTAISIENSLTLQAGNSSTLSVTYTPSDTNSAYKGVTWSSSNENVATVNSSGRVTGVAEGTATITATSTYNSSLKATCTVTVTRAIPVPAITSVDVNGYNIHVTWDASPLIDGSDVRTYTARLYQGASVLAIKTDITDTFCDFTVPGAGNNYRVTVYAVNASNNTSSSTSSQSFAVDPVITADWQETTTLPSNVNVETCDIEYQHTYRTTAQTSPGSGWTQVSGSGVTTYENDGAVWETEFAQQTSATCVQVGSYYYHYCGTGYGIEHFEASGFNTLHVAGSTDGAFQVVDTQKDSCHDILQYQLKHTAGTWAGQAALCNEGRSDWWYIKYQYQNKKAVTTYTWTKTTDWTATPDNSAYSVRYRFRLKDTAAPTIGTVSVTAITPRNYTISCQASDDLGIEKMVFASWAENETEAEAQIQEIMVENAMAEAEASATITIADHGNMRDVNYYTKVYVYDVRGKVTEYAGNDGTVYMPTMMHSSRKLTLPGDLLIIEAEAFQDTIGVGEVILSEGVTTIGSKAFADCSRLTLIHMPDSVTEIAEDAFAYSDNVVFLCASNNAAAAFARAKSIPYFTGE